MAQDSTDQKKGSWRFLNITHPYTNLKNILVTVLPLMLSHFGIICKMKFVLLQLLPVSEKAKKWLSHLSITKYVASPWYRYCYAQEIMISELQTRCWALESVWQRLSTIKVHNRIN